MKFLPDEIYSTSKLRFFVTLRTMQWPLEKAIGPEFPIHGLGCGTEFDTCVDPREIHMLNLPVLVAREALLAP